MDRVKLGRALGYGARHAGKALVQAVDAATSPAASTTRSTPAAAGVSQPVAPRVQAARPAPPVSSSASRTAPVTRKVANAARGASAMKRSMWAPLKKFSGVLWLQMTGSFFALFALALGQGLWKERADFHAAASSPQARQVYIHAFLFALFAYFTISSFVRASRRGRRS